MISYHFDGKNLFEGKPLFNPIAPFETILYTSNRFHLLDDHIYRFIHSLKDLNLRLSADLILLFKSLEPKLIGSEYRVRVGYFDHNLLSIVLYSFNKVTKDLSLKSIPYLSKEYDNSLTYKLQDRTRFDKFRLEIEGKCVDDILLLDPNRKLLETSIANIFLLDDNQFYTPTDGFFLSGIIRSHFINFLLSRGYKQILKCKNIDEINSYKYIFVTNSIKLISCIDRVDEIRFKKNYSLRDQFLSYIINQ